MWVILPTWPTNTIVVKLKGDDKLLVLLGNPMSPDEFNEILDGKVTKHD